MSSQVSPTALAVGSHVVIVVSSGLPVAEPGVYVEMPDLLGASQGEALEQLRAAGFSAQVFNDYSEVYGSGEVCGQLPPGSTGAPAGSEAVLIVSDGRPSSPQGLQTLPDVVGMPEAQAVSILQSAGFSPQALHWPSKSVPAGTVSAQLPSRASLTAVPEKRGMGWLWVAVAAFVVLAGVVAALLLSGGDMVVVPNTVGLSESEAVVVLGDAGLAAEVEAVEPEEDEPLDAVLEQNPAAGTEVTEGSTVEITVVKKPELVPVPDVVGEDQADAVQTLRDAGFTVSVLPESSDSAEKGTVLEQSPTADEGAEAGDEIVLVVSSGHEEKEPAPEEEEVSQNVQVPNVVGISSDDAKKSLTELGLDVVVVQSPSATVANGTVSSQFPAAGDSVAAGTDVGIVVSTGQPSADAGIETPDLDGMTLDEAEKALGDAGLEANPVPAVGSEPANEVVGQIPESGTLVPPGTAVAVFYSTGE